MTKHLQTLLIFAIYFFIYPIFAQTGPGGVGNSSTNGLWLKADDLNLVDGQGVAIWQDASGNENHANQTVSEQSPKFISESSFNNYPSIDFDGSNDWLRVKDANILDGTTSINYFTVVKPKGLAKTQVVQAMVSKRNGYNTSNNQFAYTFFFYNNKLTNDITDANDRYDSNYVFSNDTTYVLSFDFDGSLPEVSRSSMSRNGILLRTARETSESVLASTAPLTIGQLNVGDGRHATEELAEIIHFNYKLNIAERTIVHNYLSAKYNTPLTLNNFYTQDEIVQGNFDHHVAGIARVSDAAHLDSQGSGILRVNNPLNLGDTNDKYFFWGQNIMSSIYDFNTEIQAQDGAGILQNHQHLNVIWRVSKSEDHKDFQAVDMSFEISSFPEIIGCYSLELVIGADTFDYSTGTTNQYIDLFEIPQQIYQLNVSGGIASASGVTMNDGSHFTLRYRKNEKIVWNGTNFTNASGVVGAPSVSDSNKSLVILENTAVTLNENAFVCEIEVQTGATLNIADGLELTVQNRIVNNGTIDLLGEAQLIQNHKGANINSGSGKLKIRQQGTTNLHNYNYWSSPVSTDGFWQIGFLKQENSNVLFSPAQSQIPTSNPVTLSSRWLYKYNASVTLANGIMGWARINTTTNIEPGIGYTLKGSGSAPSLTEEEYVFSGTANSGDYSYIATSGNDFLIGNPYPSALNANKFIQDNLDVTTGTLYFYEQFQTNNTHILRDYQGGYATLNLLGSVPAATEATSGLGSEGSSTKGAPTNNIAVGQGFFVSIIQNSDIRFNNTQRVFAKESMDQSIFFRDGNVNSETDSRTKFWLSFADSSGRMREIALGYDENASEGFDKGYDAIDLSDYPDSMLWDAADNLLVIQGLQQLNVEDDIALSIKISTSGTYIIGLNRTLNFPEDTAIYLKDNQTNRFYDLKAGDASIAFQAGTYNNQYSIVYQQATLGVDDFENYQSVKVLFDKNTETLQLLGLDDLSSVKGLYIYSLEGKEVHALQDIKSEKIDIAKITQGVYILKLEMNSGAIQNIKFVKY
ncbi:T9SS type A sorting domain-containing protein [Bizionia myxarmorum]|uniref:T9SS type A sorting domain-containing protein n=1 Tax=Bizionia myxarmorum TaxID=291186 RepID=A0A5D0RF40_9FLAO|nr:T9SS type A sorting domain-containing protein [Bizionia myxarmorum]TYB79308.1 T9SS type A sorting domain-containing protein [Bizionia myxarmorum]